MIMTDTEKTSPLADQGGKVPPSASNFRTTFDIFAIQCKMPTCRGSQFLQNDLNADALRLLKITCSWQGGRHQSAPSARNLFEHV